MTPIHANSVLAYYGIDLTKRQAEVVRALENLKRATDEQIGNFLKIGINRVTGRITELTSKGVVIETGSVMGNFGKNVWVNRLKNMQGTFWQGD